MSYSSMNEYYSQSFRRTEASNRIDEQKMSQTIMFQPRLL